MAPFTTSEEILEARATLNRTFKGGLTKSIAWRKWQLKQVWWMVCDYEKAIASALHSDLHRHDFETYMVDIGAVKTDVLYHLDKVEEWAADDIPDAGFLFVASQDLIAEIIPKYLDSRAIRVVTGGPKETTLILEQRFDHIFYTGSTNVGKMIQKAAAKNLTPTTVELGGQAPAIVAASANIDVAAKRILFSKFVNSGQVCVSTNHVYVDHSVHDQFVERVGYWIKEFLKDGGKGGMSRIVSDRNYERIAGLLKGTQGKVAFGGEQDKATKYIQPTVITDVTLEDSTMSEEIFGPLLPIIRADYRKACELTQNGEHPLGIYIFSNDPKEIDYVLSHTQSGGVTINDVAMHTGIPNAPFGGVGNSGTGAYHGKYGFDTFTHKRPVVSIPYWLEYVLGFRYPPYSAKHVAKVAVNTKPGFKRGERMEDQRVGEGKGWRGLARWLLGRGLRLGLLAVVLALVDSRMGGRPWFLEVLSGLANSVRGK